MKDELTGRVGFVKTLIGGNGDTIQNFELCFEEVLYDGIPRLHTKWYSVTAKNQPLVNSGDIVSVVGEESKQRFTDGMFIREIQVFVATDVTLK